MQIGNLSRAPIRSRDIAVFQLLRVFIVIVFAAAGGYALSLTVEDQDTAQDSVAALDHSADAIVLHADELPDQTASVQIASADPASEPMDGSAALSVASEAPVQESMHARTPHDANIDQASAPPETPSSDATAPVTEQAVTAEPSPPEMTGAVNVASIANDPAPDSSLIDLNTASFEQLNALRNAGPLGRAIINGRPYASVEDLVKRKVIRRSVYEKIKDQVMVQ